MRGPGLSSCSPVAGAGAALTAPVPEVVASEVGAVVSGRSQVDAAGGDDAAQATNGGIGVRGFVGIADRAQIANRILAGDICP